MARDFEAPEPTERGESLSFPEKKGPAVPEDIAILADKERAASLNQGPELKPEDSAKLVSWRQFPNESDKHYRGLAEKEYLSSHGKGEKLSPEERADLISKRQFPKEGDKHYKDLAAKELLAADGKGEKLSPEERADLTSKRQFPKEGDKHYKDLAAKELLAADGKGEKLSPEERADLVSKRQFPNDRKMQELARRDALALSPEENEELAAERLARRGLAKDKGQAPELYGHHKSLEEKEKNGEELSKEEKADLFSKRQFPDSEHYKKLAEKELLGKEMTVEEKADLQSKRQFPDSLHFQNLARRELLASLTKDEKASLQEAWKKRETSPKDREAKERVLSFD